MEEGIFEIELLKSLKRLRIIETQPLDFMSQETIYSL